jgi:tripartite-type tricarboxylate transporter receptor subunit TctC
VKSLAILDDQPSALYPNVPTAKQAIGTNWTLATWRGIGAPKSIPADIESRLQAAVKRACESQEYRDFMTSRGFGARWAGPEEFARLMEDSDQQMGAAMKAVGLAR